MDDAALWRCERGFWLTGAPHFRRWMAAEAVMAFPPPAGVLSAPAILDAVDGMPPWAELSLTATTLARPAEGVAVLAYHAAATRADGTAYRATCTSTYAALATGWQLIQHQQTPT